MNLTLNFPTCKTRWPPQVLINGSKLLVVQIFFLSAFMELVIRGVNQGSPSPACAALMEDECMSQVWFDWLWASRKLMREEWCKDASGANKLMFYWVIHSINGSAGEIKPKTNRRGNKLTSIKCLNEIMETHTFMFHPTNILMLITTLWTTFISLKSP